MCPVSVREENKGWNRFMFVKHTNFSTAAHLTHFITTEKVCADKSALIIQNSNTHSLSRDSESHVFSQ